MLRPPIDIPMSLGSHLDELRRRLLWPIIAVAVLTVLGFAYQAELKQAMVWPLHRAIQLMPKESALLQLPTDGTSRLLQTLTLQEPATTAMQVSLYAALACAAPVILWNLWHFVAVGLTRKERRLAFLFVPAGIIMFYIGGILGYFVGLPWMYAFLIKFAALDPTTVFMLRQSDYVHTFFAWTVVFGLIMDIPWLIIVLVRVGLVTPQQIGKSRKIAIMANVVLAAIICPEATSMVALAIPMILLFEAGLLISRAFVPKPLSEPAVEVDRA